MLLRQNPPARARFRLRRKTHTVVPELAGPRVSSIRVGPSGRVLPGFGYDPVRLVLILVVLFVDDLYLVRILGIIA